MNYSLKVRETYNWVPESGQLWADLNSAEVYMRIHLGCYHVPEIDQQQDVVSVNLRDGTIKVTSKKETKYIMVEPLELIVFGNSLTNF